MGNTNSRSSYEQYYEALKQPAQGATVVPSVKDVDPYEVLGVAQGCSWEHLKNAYRRTARLVHPDKGGSPMLFNLVTDCFKQIATDMNLREANKNHNEMKQAAQTYYTENKARLGIEVQDFQGKFNQLFDENKFKDPESDDHGYGNMMEKSSAVREDIKIARSLDKYNKKKFNEVFEQNVAPSTEVIIYKEPQALVLSKKLAFTEIGGGKPEDFSADTTKPGALHYTDYMKAHTTTRLVDPRAIQPKKQYRSVEAYEADREKAIERGPTEDELAFQAAQKRKLEKAEAERLRRTQQRDAAIAAHYERVNQATITWRNQV